MVDPEGMGQFSPLLDGPQQGRHPLGTEHDSGVWIEGEHHAGHPKFAPFLHYAPNQFLVPAVYTVENTNGYSAAASNNGGWDPVQSVPNTHGRNASPYTVAMNASQSRSGNRLPAPTASVLTRSGLVVVDKPAGMTSHDVVSKLRRVMRTKRVGHSGTLDPMATGVLVVGVERGTKFLAHVVTHDKRYEATVRLGTATVTDDMEGEVLSHTAPLQVSEEDIRRELQSLTGEIMQRPSSVSSIKVNGRRAHELVREGKEVVLPERPVTIFNLTVGDIRPLDKAGRRVSFHDASLEHIDVDISVHCSSGTYIRSIARDLGETLGCGGHLTALRRTSVGPFTIAQARTLDELNGAADNGTQPEDLLALHLDAAMVACFPTREISTMEGKDLALGKWLEPVGNKDIRAAVTPGGHAIALLKEKGKRAASVFVARPHGMN